MDTSRRAARWISEGFEELLRKCAEDPPAPPEPQLQSFHYDIVIVGSGYGGSIAAAELAGRKEPDGGATRLCVLERGSEYLPGMFPSNEAELPGHVRFSTPGSSKTRGRQTGLLDVRLGPDVCALVANGLGGGSLINAGVMEEAKADAWSAGRWPEKLKNPSSLATFYARARELLGVSTPDGGTNTILGHPCGAPRKYQALRSFSPPPAFRAAALSISMKNDANSAGVELNACLQCGDCATGCNQAAKNSLDENLLVQAYRRGADIFVGATVMQLRKITGGWAIEVVHTEPKLRRRSSNPLELRARRVILAAGTFGSTEILLRSARDELALSPRLGQGFSTNGDMLAVAFGQNRTVNAIADAGDPPGLRCVGPTITGLVDLRTQRAPTAIEEFAIPGPLRRLFAESFTLAHALKQLATADNEPHASGTGSLDPAAVDPTSIARTQVFGVMGHDGAAGSLELVQADEEAEATDGAIRVRWPQLRKDARFTLFEDQVETLERLRAGSNMGGEILPNPVWQLMPAELDDVSHVAKGPAFTVHPLGGCCIGDRFEAGVVDHMGRVFNPGGVHDGLVVLDGSIIPSSLAINPALTIAAVALRAVTHLRHEWGMLQATPPDLPDRRDRCGERPRFRTPLYQPAEPTEVEFIERMSGRVMLTIGGRAQERVAELTMKFQPTQLRSLMGPLARTLVLDPDKSRVRCFLRSDWHWLTRENRPESDYDRLARESAALEGSLRVLDREQSTAAQRRCRALHAWFVNRGLREALQALFDVFRPRELRRHTALANLWSRIRMLCSLATRAGEVRVFEYELTVRAPSGSGVLEAGQRIAGSKRLTYSRKSNPWTQLQTMTLEDFPALHASSRRELTLDPRFLAGRGVPLFQVVRQADHATALFEVASFLLYLLRLLLSVHVWSLRRYDPQPLREPQRLPAEVPGLPLPQIDQIEVDRLPGGAAVSVRLTRYPRTDSVKKPVVLIHGYSASGTTFAHHAVDPNLASYLWKRGRDVWILDLRTSSGMSTARHPWTFEQPAHEDIPVALDYIERTTQCGQLDIVAHCMGSAMLTMALLGRPAAGARYFAERERLPLIIRAIVLSQVAPVVVFSPNNVFRAYIMGFLREMFDLSDYEFRPQRPPTPADEILDRFLATIPYPEGEYSIENPLWPWQKNDFVRTRHRMDALYGRDFNLVNIAPRVLDYIDDLFGPLSMKTVLHAIHYARTGLITDHRGRNLFVKRPLLRRYWANIPTLSIHGEDNGLADVGTLLRMRDVMRDAGVRIYKTHMEPGHGHQDCLIGRHAHRVFKQIQDFLDNPGSYQSPSPLPEAMPPATAAAAAPAPAPTPTPMAALRAATGAPLQARATDPLLARTPWIGPIRGARVGNREIEVTLAADPQLGEPIYAAYAPVSAADDRFVRHPLNNGQPLRALTWLGGEAGEPVRLRISFEHWPAQAQGALIMLIYDQSDVIGKGVDDGRPWRDVVEIPPEVVRAADDYLEHRTEEELQSGYMTEDVRLVASDTLLRSASPEAPACSFAVGSCKYPPGPFDATLASASYRRLNELLESDVAGKPTFAVLMGDQIYSDATAGLFDPAAQADRYVIPHEKLLRDTEVRRLLQRIPSYMMLDDHEIEDNWEPAYGENGEDSAALRVGRAAYLKYQRTQGPPAPTPIGDAPCPLWYQEEPGGLPFFFADTRTERRGRDVSHLADASIMSDAQLAALLAWIRQRKGDPRPKFIVSAAMFLPGRLRCVEPASSAIHADAWQGFAPSRNEVLAALLQHESSNLVFLSGDEHHSSVTRIVVRDPASGKGITCHSLHCSALYAPYVFANGRPEDLVERHIRVPFRDAAGHAYEFDTQTEFIPCADAFAVIDCFKDANGSWHLRYRFHQRDATCFGPFP